MNLYYDLKHKKKTFLTPPPSINFCITSKIIYQGKAWIQKEKERKGVEGIVEKLIFYGESPEEYKVFETYISSRSAYPRNWTIKKQRLN